MRIQTLKNLLDRLRDESGSAITEFVIGLPIFILIFAGMGSLYKINHEAIKAKATVNAALWAQANPGAGALIPIAAVLNISNFGDLAANGASVLGIYADSYAKTLVPLLIPNSRPASGCPTIECAQIGMLPDYFSKTLLEDNMVNGIADGDLSASGWAAALSSGLTITGSRPAFAAGIRYGAVEAASVGGTVALPMWGSYSFETGDLQVPGVTDPTHRVLAVALTRIEFATDEIFNEQIPQFNEEFDFGSASADAGECTGAVTNYENCTANPPNNPFTGQPDTRMCDDLNPANACEGLAADNPLADISAGYCSPGIPGC